MIRLEIRYPDGTSEWIREEKKALITLSAATGSIFVIAEIEHEEASTVQLNPADAIDVILKAIHESKDKQEAVRFWLTVVTNQLTAVLNEVSETEGT